MPSPLCADDATRRCRRVYGAVQTVTDGNDLSEGGISGSMRPKAMAALLGWLGVPEGATFCDLGAGVGRPVLCAWLLGSARATGYELPCNGWHGDAFRLARARLAGLANPAAAAPEWVAADLTALPRVDAEAVMAFWVGMPPAVQAHVLRLCAGPTVRRALLFRTRGFPTPEAVLAAWPAGHGFRLLHTQPVSMSGSGEGKTAWVFGRDVTGEAPRAARRTGAR